MNVFTLSNDLCLLRGMLELLMSHTPGLCHGHVARGSDVVGSYKFLALGTAQVRSRMLSPAIHTLAFGGSACRCSVPSISTGRAYSLFGGTLSDNVGEDLHL